MRLPLLVFALVLALLPLSASSSQEPAVTTIAGGNLPGVITFTRTDHDDFVRRLDLPPLFENPPAVGGPAFTVVSPYWDEAIRAGRVNREPVDNAATYYSDSGYVLAKQDGRDVWTALDTRQRAILDRYVRLGAVLPANPTALDLLRISAAEDETVGINIGGVALTPEQRTAFWNAAAGLQPTAIDPPTPIDFAGLAAGSEYNTWIIFTLPEARTVQMLYSVVTGIVMEAAEVALDGTMYPVQRDWLVPVLGDVARIGETYGLQPLEIPQQEGSGSMLWWIVGLAAGLGAIAVSVYLQRLMARTRPA